MVGLWDMPGPRYRRAPGLTRAGPVGLSRAARGRRRWPCVRVRVAQLAPISEILSQCLGWPRARRGTLVISSDAWPPDIVVWHGNDGGRERLTRSNHCWALSPHFQA